MQSINNLSPRGRKLLIGLVIAFIVLPLFYVIYAATNNSDPNKQGTYYDKNSGQTITNDGKTPEIVGVDTNKPTYLGTTDLYDIGVTRYQLAATQDALFSFAKTVTDKPKELSIDVKSITEVSYNPEAAKPVSETSFILQVDRKTKYKVKLQYSGISTARIIVENLKGELLYTSKEIDGSKITE